MAVSVVQSIAHVGNPPATFSGSITAGNTVFIIAAGYTTTSGNPSTGTVKLGGGTVTGTVAFFNPGSTGGVLSPLNGGNGAYITIWMLPNIQLASQTAVDMTFTGASGVIGQCIYEVAGLGTSPTLDVSNSGGSGTGTAVTSGASGAISSATEIVFGGTMAFAGTPSTNSGWTCLQPSGGADLTAGYQIPSSSGGSYTWSQTSSGSPWAAFVAAVQGTPAPPPAVYTLLSAPYRPPPPPLLVPAQVITGQAPPPPAELAGTVQASGVPFLAPWQVAPQVITEFVPSVTASAGLAAGTGAALGPVPVVTPAAGLAAGAGAAQQPVPGVTAAAGAAQGTGTAQGPSPALTVPAGLATAAGAALAPVPAVTASAGDAAGTGTALQPAVSGSGQASAGQAAGTGAALQPSVSVTAPAGLASASGQAQAPGPSVAALAGQAAATASALAPLAAVQALAGLAAAAGTAPQPSIPGPGDITAHAGLAAAAGTAQAQAFAYAAVLFSVRTARRQWQVTSARNGAG